MLGVVVFALYVNYLDNIIKDEFSKPESSDFMSYEQQSKTVVNMLLITEDQSFFSHPGVDFKEILRVVRDYVWRDKPLRGASTITQQLIKNSLLTRERTIDRKLKEIVMALLLELSFDKNFILNYYMNSVYLGQKGNLSIHGFHQVAQFYFNNDIDKLTLEEMATLVALVKGPSYYHPIKQSQRLAERRQLVLRLYHKYEKIVK
ncbi:Multimodular transpeptidase-transglycosylase [Bathymodiolus heckerae thiotrophic gill symbiont]|uniref:biosynthetic peptidoglycan transglycosylase n=1 Tax=Bathymodiolus heckerae thiotrophic gill symbiont TaxID=1052212 RepID=UPI0010B2A72E|nr:biosynthetic peptidoglycan transglycosylase [Bathymodiolus heckerae thiotrophic gill symbiont]CAC9956046.1 Multimodular transpeptidase-transglycosylase (EC 2.4.1.129) (EC 3.4.-.-) [uncultured Gammaproteobacteria bacterium]SHN92055.1 Multimodular transpeptidase-transglycosylase [Bathymodiolus heckerae thiotrophic gill symbiont]